MSNPEHLEILKSGVPEWNAWREANPRVIPDLTGAMLAKARMEGAVLSGAILTGAVLSGAWLEGAYLAGAIGIMAIGPIGSRGGMTYAVRWDDGIMIQCGCLWDTIEEWIALCEAHPDATHRAAYAAAAVMIMAYANSYWRKS